MQKYLNYSNCIPLCIVKHEERSFKRGNKKILNINDVQLLQRLDVDAKVQDLNNMNIE